jgi:hypothetical protein
MLLDPTRYKLTSDLTGFVVENSDADTGMSQGISISPCQFHDKMNVNDRLTFHTLVVSIRTARFKIQQLYMMLAFY